MANRKKKEERKERREAKRKERVLKRAIQNEGLAFMKENPDSDEDDLNDHLTAIYGFIDPVTLGMIMQIVKMIMDFIEALRERRNS